MVTNACPPPASVPAPPPLPSPTRKHAHAFTQKTTGTQEPPAHRLPPAAPAHFPSAAPQRGRWVRARRWPRPCGACWRRCGRPLARAWRCSRGPWATHWPPWTSSTPTSRSRLWCGRSPSGARGVHVIARVTGVVVGVRVGSDVKAGAGFRVEWGWGWVQGGMGVGVGSGWNGGGGGMQGWRVCAGPVRLVLRAAGPPLWGDHSECAGMHRMRLSFRTRRCRPSPLPTPDRPSACVCPTRAPCGVAASVQPTGPGPRPWAL
jgi:hypothetical protein